MTHKLDPGYCIELHIRKDTSDSVSKLRHDQH